MVDLRGKVALVTGSSQGIGRGCLVEMARCGADAIVNYRSHPDEAEEVAEEIRSFGRKAIVVHADVAEREQVDAMVAKGIADLGHIDIVVANAAISIRKPVLEMSLDDVKKTWNVCLWGVFHTLQSSIRHMVERGRGGKALVISSVHAFIPFANSVAYNTAKAGMNNMALTFAEEMTPHKINVNVIEPGWIDTPGERKYYPEETIKEDGAALPWGRIGTIADVGKPAAFICSDAADYITGAVLRVDGGFWLPQRTVE